MNRRRLLACTSISTGGIFNAASASAAPPDTDLVTVLVRRRRAVPRMVDATLLLPRRVLLTVATREAAAADITLAVAIFAFMFCLLLWCPVGKMRKCFVFWSDGVRNNGDDDAVRYERGMVVVCGWDETVNI